MIRVGILGAGFIGRIHSWSLWALRRSGLVEAAVTAVCDADPARAAEIAEPHGASVLGDLDDLLRAVDAVYVCTPTAGHLEAVEAAAGRGLAVFCEKPLAPTLEDAERVSVALSTVPHQVGLVLRTAPVFVRMRDVLLSRGHGRPMAAVFRDDQYLPNQGQYASVWRTDSAVAGGGTLIEHSIHDVDLLSWFLGPVRSTSCTTSSFAGHPRIEDVAVAGLCHEHGGTSSLVSVWHHVLSRPSTRRLEIFCERAVVWTEDDNTGPLHVQTSEGAETLPCEPPPWVDELPVPEEVRRALGRYAIADRLFCEAVAGGRSPAEREDVPGADEALAAHRLVDAAYRSAAEDGAPVAL